MDGVAEVRFRKSSAMDKIRLVQSLLLWRER